MRSLLLVVLLAAGVWLGGPLPLPASVAAAPRGALPASVGAASHGSLVASVAAASRGSLVASPTFVPEAGPVLAGDGGLAWLRRRDDAVLDLWVAERGKAPRRVQRFVGSDTESLRSPRLSASSTTVGLELFEVARRRRSRAVVTSSTYLGAFGEPLTRVGSCASANRGVRSIDVGEDVAAFRGRGCRPTAVRSPAAAGAVPELRLPSGAFGMRAAGRFVAWLSGTTATGDPRTAVVRDGASGVLAEHALGAGLVDQALHPDGTLALAYRTRLAILGPGAVAERSLALTLLAPQTVHWVGDALAVVAADGAHPGAGVLEIVDRQGSPVQRIAELGADRELLRHADVDEQRAAWVARGCRSAQIRTVALPVAAVPRYREPPCRLRLREPARLHGDRLRLGISCAGFVVDCAARVVVRVGRRVIARGVASYNHGTPPFAAARLRVTGAGMRLLRRDGGARLRISARIGALATRRTTQAIRVGRR
jgi:hypothetical protein